MRHWIERKEFATSHYFKLWRFELFVHRRTFWGNIFRRKAWSLDGDGVPAINTSFFLLYF